MHIITRTPIAILLLAMGSGLGCRTAAPMRETHASAPPWVTNGSEAAPVVLSVPAGQTTTIDGPARISRLTVGAGAKVSAPALAEATGWIVVEDGAVLTATNLRACAVLVVDEGAQVIAPELRQVELAAVEDDAKMVAPSLRQCGGVRLGDGVTFDAPCADQKARQVARRR